MEKLVRFKTATVTMHVQPFKYTIYNEESFQNLLTLRDSNISIDGVTANAKGNEITVSGKSTHEGLIMANVAVADIETPKKLSPGTYIFSAYTTGESTDHMFSLHRNFHFWVDDSVDEHTYASVNATLYEETSKTFNLTDEKELNIFDDITMDFGDKKIDAVSAFTLRSVDFSSPQKIINNGNIYARPLMTIYGSGTINLSINGTQLLVIEMGEEEYITIDAENMEASKDGVLKNRLVTGNIDNIRLQPGTNEISWSGDVTDIKFKNASRWI